MNLETFKLGKSQMNSIRGGRNYDCHVSNVDVGGTISEDIEVTANSEESAELSLRAQYPDCYVSCT